MKCGVKKNKRASLCGVFKFSHKSPGCREKKGRAEAEEGGAETVVTCQNLTDAKVAAMEEVGGRERERKTFLSI